MAEAALAPDFRIVMIGKNREEKAKLGTFLTAKSSVPYERLSKQSSVFFGQWARKSVKVYNTSDLFDDPEPTEKVQRLLSACDPRPNAFLLLVNPSDFTQTDRDKLYSVLKCFGDDTFKCSLVIATRGDNGWNSHFNALKQDCGQRLQRVDFNELYGLVQKCLMDKVQDMIEENSGGPFAGQMEQTVESEPIYDYPTVVLNMVMCGGFGDWKALASKAILGRKENPSKLTNTVKNVRKVGVHRVSIVELPALSSLKEDAARHESLQCLSLCEPEGIHAFVLVQPVGPLNPEDKQEQDAIRREFTSKMNAFKMILFMVDSESVALAMSNFIRSSKDIQELCQSCNDRYIIFNISNKEQVPEVVKMVVDISDNGSKSFTRQMTTKPQIKKRQTFVNAIPTLKDKGQQKSPSVKKETLRIVLIGKTGSGKSATANNILGRTEFESKISQTSVTKWCKKAEGQIEGRSVAIVDTPGLFDTALTNTQIQNELVKCVSLLAPGPHVFLLVLQIGRFTQEEHDTVKLIKEFFGKAAENYMIVVFTRGDDLENMSLEEYLKDGKGAARALLEECGNRYHVLNNKAKQNRKQIHELLRKIEAMVQQNRGGFFSSELFEEAEKAIEKETVKLLKQKEPVMKKQEQDIEEKHQEKVKDKKSKILELKAKIEEEIRQRAQQVKEKQARLEKEQENRRRYEQRRQEEERMKLQEDELQIQEWNNRYANLVKQLNTKSDSATKRSSLMILKEDLKREQEEWQQKRQEWWAKRTEEDKRQREEENRRLKQLEHEYAEAKKLFEQKKHEDEQRRHNEEREIRAMQEKHRRQMEEIRRQNEEEARRQAEALNDFQRKYAKERDELKRLRDRRQSADEYLLRQINKNKTHRRDFQTLKLKHKREMEELEQLQTGYDGEFLSKEVEGLRKQHEDEIQEWIEDKVSSMSGSSCAIL